MQNAIQPLVHMLLSTLLWVVPLMVVAALLGSPWGKGHVGEWFVRFMLRWQLDKAVYFPLHNVTLTTPDGSTQIDHVIVSRFGIFAIETKNMQGWIFGSERQAEWTQKIFKRSFRFQNPLRQNYKHTRALPHWGHLRVACGLLRSFKCCTCWSCVARVGAMRPVCKRCSRACTCASENTGCVNDRM